MIFIIKMVKFLIPDLGLRWRHEPKGDGVMKDGQSLKWALIQLRSNTAEHPSSSSHALVASKILLKLPYIGAEYMFEF